MRRPRTSKIIRIVFWTTWPLAVGFAGGWFVGRSAEEAILAQAAGAIRRCTETLNDASATIAWAMYEIDRLTGKRPGNPKKPPERPEPWHPL
jgi:hypothetical protein